jgi:uncharacterized protein with ParB-like and HNH nuclease domain
MRADAIPLLTLFERKMRLEVPLFQRQYVWTRENQWEPLWEDIATKFRDFLEGRKDTPAHFLGAMVVDQKQTPVTHVEKRQVIDGQQRLTTLQIFLAALRDFCKEQECAELNKELDNYTTNKGMMADADVEKYKVWPTQLDREQFKDVIGLGSREAIETKHPLKRKKYTRKYEPRPLMVEAYAYFSDQIREFFLGTEQEPPLAATFPVASRVDEAFQALKQSLKVVVIDLEKDDDAQVIFETLNGRGEPLLPADLLRNYIFLRAARVNEPQEKLYEKYWRKFDEDFWREEVQQGRLYRPRSDLFMQHFLASRRMVEIPIKHLFVEYKYWIGTGKPFTSIEQEFATLAKQRDDFRRVIDPQKDDVLFDLATFLERFDIRTAYPLLLCLLDATLGKPDWQAISTILESYLLRRTVVGWTTKAYNRVFLNLTKALRDTAPSPENLKIALSALSGESSAWPTDEQFWTAWRDGAAYHYLNNAKLVHILWRLSSEHLTKHNEQITIESPLTVEHILPQFWEEHWPLPSGEKGLSEEEREEAESDDPRLVATLRRDNLLQTLGNLTILTQELNSSVSNAPWNEKQPELLQYSLLPINQELHKFKTWDEDAISQRGKQLFEKARKIWPGPG